MCVVGRGGGVSGNTGGLEEFESLLAAGHVPDPEHDIWAPELVLHRLNSQHGPGCGPLCASCHPQAPNTQPPAARLSPYRKPMCRSRPRLKAPSTFMPCTSLQVVTQRMHLMHFSRSSLMAREDCREGLEVGGRRGRITGGGLWSRAMCRLIV